MSASSYLGREAELADLFGARLVRVTDSGLELDGRVVPVVDGVILAIDPSRLPDGVRARIEHTGADRVATKEFAPDIQDTFGAEWTEFDEVLPEHTEEFAAYFDLVDLEALRDARVADLGCGSGRWASFVAPRCRSFVAVDFSEAIFTAQRNLADVPGVVFVLADVLDLPFRDDAFDFAYCLGVLHHTPVDAVEATRRLARLTPRLLVYLYYALDNRPAYFRWLLGAVTAVRRRFARVRAERIRSVLTWVVTLLVYVPLAMLGRVLRPVRLDRFVPLAETYAGKSVRRLRQDAYDRFFTRIEQRVTREEIRALTDTFASVRISDGLPYWHFLCERA